MAVQDLLPPELWTKIYEYDDTYRKCLVACHEEMRSVLFFLSVASFSNSYEDIMKRLRKVDILKLCRFLHISIPAKATKKSLAQLIYVYVKGVLPSSPIL